MYLNYILRTPKFTRYNTPIIVIHGLFGNLSNLGIIASHLMEYHPVIQVDLRNHGKSPHKKSMTYFSMAKDIVNLLDNLLIKKCIVIGHSMGGKVAMMLCALIPLRVIKIVVIDIAPVKYVYNHKHDDIFLAIEAVNKFGIHDRNTAKKIMQKYLINQKLILFLLKSFNCGTWNFNFLSIKNNYHHINDWCIYETWWGPTLFIKGMLSTYLINKHFYDIYHQFPKSYICTVPQSGHWVHSEQPKYVVDIIKKFIFSHT